MDLQIPRTIPGKCTWKKTRNFGKLTNATRSSISPMVNMWPSIQAADAHDAGRQKRSTTLEVSPPNVVTLTVHHRDGNSARPFPLGIRSQSIWVGETFVLCFFGGSGGPAGSNG